LDDLGRRTPIPPLPRTPQHLSDLSQHGSFSISRYVLPLSFRIVFNEPCHLLGFPSTAYSKVISLIDA
jgi:hypothetical protein